ncbi:MAG: hypothetical protein MI922_20590, partial [Bacteroidales bacterium]|nr:hypothetical protein [Bacteroidales bacterium]
MKTIATYHVSNHSTRICRSKCLKSTFLILLIAQLFLSFPVDAKITYWLDETALNSSKKDQIIAAMDSCVNAYNAYSDYDDNVKVIYDASIPTANASYQGRIAFGGSISARVALHEMSHVLGIGTYSKWNENRNTTTKKWTSPIALAQLAVFNGDGTSLNADKWHFWPYGLNTKWEEAYCHVYMVGAFREDMGLSNTSGQGTISFMYIKHKSSGKLL